MVILTVRESIIRNPMPTAGADRERLFKIEGL